jgi:hypothetical protein
MHRLSYANVMATVAVFLALGGSSYAALRIGSKQLVNNSVRSGDLRNNDVRGKDIRTGAVRSADVGDGSLLAADFKPGELPPPVDPAQFVPAAGTSTIAVGPSAWEIEDGGPLEKQTVAGNRLDFRATNAGGNASIVLHPTLPSSLAGKPVRLRAITLCVDATHPNATLGRVNINTFRGPLSGGADAAVATLEDLTDREDSVCRRYDLPASFLLSDPRDYLSVGVGMAWDAVGGELQFSGTTFEFERAG